MNKLIHGDCLEIMAEMAENSVDSIVTDPPAGIAFMGKSWDKDKGGRDQWIAWMTGVAEHCLRVLKPGGHALVWALPRTSHWTATAWEDAGFDLREKIFHIFGSGFPKNHDVSKAIDRTLGMEREVVGSKISRQPTGIAYAQDKWTKEHGKPMAIAITAPASEEAKQWSGWGSSLKPCAEEWLLLRKPLSEKTIAKNVLKWGTGGINIDGCRIETSDKDPNIRENDTVMGGFQSDYVNGNQKGKLTKHHGISKGRWPGTIIHDGSEEACAGFPETNGGKKRESKPGKGQSIFAGKNRIGFTVGDSGSAARYFYCAKPSQKEKSEGLDERSTHPTIKAMALMQYLCRLITPPAGTVLDPFMGSGTTGKACMSEGFGFVGIEKEKEYYDIACKRIEHEKAKQDTAQQMLF